MGLSEEDVWTSLGNVWVRYCHEAQNSAVGFFGRLMFTKPLSLLLAVRCATMVPSPSDTAQSG